MHFVKCFLMAIAAFFVAGVTSCAAFTLMVWNSHDGQAGMGAAFGGFFIACTTSVVTFIVTMVRSDPSRKRKIDH
jgi:hypothetical protein